MRRWSRQHSLAVVEGASAAAALAAAAAQEAALARAKTSLLPVLAVFLR